ncbi:uncharacterized protein CC84DRAFT_1207683 [Paraphaeosphaeria sporulosa]|uniref:RING-type domain-containing protein n=1 Tax=Paraphaeosphaeria sporulosa TaxID=1460663 RepID=A0A177C5H1_9PLEO|nr:uncharacterized protein CC84DRAFT_1207683 [Paraphaeosphaeria sporulosa]OAG02863.1 hypothetical protein CC84DRAFT_1207683 [Paraphaeosphaeria sporulosa]
MAPCSSCRRGKADCTKERCPDPLSDSDSDSDISDDERSEPVYPSTLPTFESDLTCFRRIFPSMINSLNSADDPVEMGWLAGCVHDVVLCLQSHLIEEALRARYYREDRPVEEGQGPVPEGVVEYIKPKQLLEFYNLIHEEVEVQYLSKAAVPLTDRKVEQKIRAKEAMFGTMLDNAIKEMWWMEDEDDPEENHEELYSVRGGWDAAREDPWSYPPWVYGPADVHGPVQLEPDRTPTEYKTTGDPVPMSAFSVAYQGPHPVRGTCLVCMDELANPDSPVVAARCSKGHLFHGSCLNKWVNASAMDNANLCPHDRERLCDPRQRIHPGGVSDVFDEEESDADGSDSEDSETVKSDSEDSDAGDDIDMDSSELDQEGSDADAEGSDDDLFDMDINEDERNEHCTEELDEAALVRFLRSDEEFMY